MDEFEVSTMIDRPVEESLAFLAKLENDAKWRTEWVEIRNMSGGSLGIGATFLLVSELLGRRIETVYEVTEYEPNQVAGWKTVSGPLQLKFWRTFEPVESGTRFAVRSDTRGRHAAS